MSIDNNLKIKGNTVVGFIDEFVEDIIIPEGITKIADNAFEKYYGLKTISFPTSLKSIGAEAFLKCSSLEEIILKENVTLIDRCAFRECSALIKVDFSISKITELPYECFAHCYKLKEVFLPNSLLKIVGRCFFRCKNLTLLDLSEGLKVIEDDFYECESLKSLYIPSTLIHIESIAYRRNFEKIILSQEQKERFVDFLPKNAKFEIVTIINGCVFQPNSYPDFVFDNDSERAKGKTSDIRIVKYIGDGKNIIIPEGVTHIECEVFENLEIELISLPKSLIEIATPNFVSCRVMSFDCSKNDRYSVLNGFILKHNGHKDIKFAGCLIEDGNTIIASLGNSIPTDSDITDIEEGAFANNSKCYLTIPKNIKNIYNGAFANCHSLEELCIEHSIEYIENRAFDCNNLERIIISTYCKDIESGAFCIPNGNSLNIFLLGENIPQWAESCVSYKKYSFFEGKQLPKIQLAGTHYIWTLLEWEKLAGYSTPVSKNHIIHICKYFNVYFCGLSFGISGEDFNIVLGFENNKILNNKYEYSNKIVKAVSIKVDDEERINEFSKFEKEYLSHDMIEEDVVRFSLFSKEFIEEIKNCWELSISFVVLDEDDKIIDSFSFSCDFFREDDDTIYMNDFTGD